MKKAVCYIRVSRKTQETERQETNLTSYAKEKKIEVLEVFREKITGVSSAFEREEFSKMIDFIRENSISLVLTTELSRIGRDKQDVVNILEYFIKNKINVIFKDNAELKLLNDKGERDWMASIVLDVLTSFSVMERETTLERNKDGMRHSLSKGGAGHGILKAFGFKNENKKLVVCEEEAEVIRLIFKKYLEGLGTGQIANFLNLKGIKTKFNRVFPEDKMIRTKKGILKEASDFIWKDGTIYGILKNEIYIGKRKINEYDSGDKKARKIIKTHVYSVPPIIDAETFHKVQEKLSDNYNKKGNNNKYENILKDKITCGICRRNYYMHKRADNSDNAYKCLSIRYKENCGNHAIGIDRLNNALYLLLKDYVKLNNKEVNENIERIQKSIENDIISKKAIIKQIEKEEKKFENILRIAVNKKIFQELVSKQEIEIGNKIDSLNASLKKIITIINEKSQQIETLKKVNFEESIHDTEIFKEYVGKTIDKCVITKYPMDDSLRKIFVNKQDKLVHVDLTTINNTQHYFILSQRTNKMLLILMDSFYENTPKNTYIELDYDYTISI